MNNELLLSLEIQRLREENSELRREADRSRNELDALRSSLREEKVIGRQQQFSVSGSSLGASQETKSLNISQQPPYIVSGPSGQVQELRRSGDNHLQSQQTVFLLSVPPPQSTLGPMMPMMNFVPQYSLYSSPQQQQQSVPQGIPMQAQPMYFQPQNPFTTMPFMPQQMNMMPKQAAPMPPPMPQPQHVSKPLNTSTTSGSNKGSPIILSDRKPFVHHGVVYPPGLNRKEYRTVIFNHAEGIEIEGNFPAPPGSTDGEIEQQLYESWLADHNKTAA